MQIQYSKKANKNLKQYFQSAKQRQIVKDKIHQYADTKQGDVIPLQGEFKGLHRLRVGSFRVILMIDIDNDILNIVAILPRQNAYNK